MQRKPRHALLVVLVGASVVLAVAGVFGFVAMAADGVLFETLAAQEVTRTETFSTTEHTTYTRVDLENLDEVETRLVATFDGAVVFDQTLSGSIDTPTGAAAAGQAQAALAASCAVAGPTATREETISTTEQVGEEPNGSTETVTLDETIGPSTIMIGPNQSESFFVEPGTINTNVNTHTEFFVDQLFHTTITRTTTYTLAGTACGAPPPAPVVVVPATPVPAQPRTAG